MTVLIGLVFAILYFVRFNAATELAPSSEFCEIQCHELSTPYESWKLPIHDANKLGFQVECTDCHEDVGYEH